MLFICKCKNQQEEKEHIQTHTRCVIYAWFYSFASMKFMTANIRWLWRNMKIHRKFMGTSWWLGNWLISIFFIRFFEQILGFENQIYYFPLRFDDSKSKNIFILIILQIKMVEFHAFHNTPKLFINSSSS